MTAAISDGLTSLERSLIKAVFEGPEEPRGDTLEILKRALGLDHVLSLNRHLLTVQEQIAVTGLHLPLLQPVDDVLAGYMRLTYWTQSWATRYPLLTSLGYMGSIYGLAPADHLFTRVAASPYARAVLRPDTSDALVPNVLLNGTSAPRPGVLGVPPHALSDVVRLVRKLIVSKKLSSDAIARILLAPDFPTGGILLSSRDELAALYRTGRGTLRLRGKSHAEPCTWSGAKEALVVTQLPYGVALGAWIEDLKEMMLTGELRGLIDIVQLSENDDGPIHILLQPNRWTPADVHGFLCRYTRFECDIECEMRVLNAAGQEVVCSLEELVQGWLEQRLSRHGRAAIARELEAVVRVYCDTRRTDIGQLAEPAA